MKYQSKRKLLVALITSVVAGLLAYAGLSIEKRVIEEVIEEAIPTYNVSDDSISLTQTGVVQKIIDGDTIVVFLENNEVTVRVIGIDTPETAVSPEGEQCYGEEATDYATSLLLGKTVTVSTDETQDVYDKYGRLLAYISVDNSDFGQQLIENGFAKEFTYRFPYQKQVLYRTLESEAKKTSVGIWKNCL